MDDDIRQGGATGSRRKAELSSGTGAADRGTRRGAVYVVVIVTQQADPGPAIARRLPADSIMVTAGGVMAAVAAAFFRNERRAASDDFFGSLSLLI
jgi:hypothetical protein